MSTYSANINRYNKHACTTIVIVLSIIIIYSYDILLKKKILFIHFLVLDIYNILLHINVLANYTVVILFVGALSSNFGSPVDWGDKVSALLFS